MGLLPSGGGVYIPGKEAASPGASTWTLAPPFHTFLLIKKHWDLGFKLLLALESNRPTANTSFVDVFCNCQCRDVITDLSVLHLHTVVKEQTLATQFFQQKDSRRTYHPSFLPLPSSCLPFRRTTPLSFHLIISFRLIRNTG
jgi:hypothetical protein